ncbi:cAMP and cAMP-inhibited cGMP 3',5'-cyclic phosphodiesterase 10A isoform X2 [Halyomorpha halys]|nr:cAMP and cAMP-inhibited cGMP 3',5'-cyclic phosphodiesterase 10A-like isoform X2 [Halyomorpha halys]
MGQNLILDHDSDYGTLYPLGIGRGGLKPVHLISTPILTQNGDCKGVFEFSNISPNKTFTKAQTDMCSCMVGWFGQSVTIKTVQYASNVDIYQSLFDALGRFQTYHGDPEILISDALKVLRNAVPMDKVNYYEVHDGPELRCRLRAQVGNDKWQIFPEYTLKGEDIIRMVLINRNIKNMSREDISLLKGPMKHQFRGVFSYLCVPIGIKIIRGVVELINKKDADAFADSDVDEAVRCGIHCVAGLFYSKLYSKKQKIYAMCENQNKTLAHHMTPCSHELDLVAYQKANLTMPDNFFTFAYYPKEEELPNLTSYAWFIFRDVFHVQKSDVEKSNKLLNFILKTKQGYRNLPYHNFEHAFIFCHCMYIITGLNTDLFSDMERKALIIAAICHDIDHPGTTNKFIEDTEHHLTLLYHDSFLENHHASICRMLVQSCGIFSELNSEKYGLVIKNINSAITATDLSLYFSARYKMMDILMNNSFSPKNKTHKELLTAMMLTACDLCGQCKTFRVTERLCRNLYKEFYAEAELLLQNGIQPICVMDKMYNSEVPKYQVQFNSEVCLPCYYILSIILENTKELHKRCFNISEQWNRICSTGSYWNVFTEEYIYPA